MHPYPHKLVESKEILIPGKLMKSNSLKSSDFDQENQSPKLVLSTVGSGSLGSSDSDAPNGSLPPMSSMSGVHTSGFTLAEAKTPSEEAVLNADLAHDKKPLMKFKLIPNESVSVKEDTTKESSTRTQTFWHDSSCNRDLLHTPYNFIEHNSDIGRKILPCIYVQLGPTALYLE